MNDDASDAEDDYQRPITETELDDDGVHGRLFIDTAKKYFIPFPIDDARVDRFVDRANITKAVKAGAVSVADVSAIIHAVMHGHLFVYGDSGEAKDTERGFCASLNRLTKLYNFACHKVQARVQLYVDAPSHQGDMLTALFVAENITVVLSDVRRKTWDARVMACDYNATIERWKFPETILEKAAASADQQLAVPAHDGDAEESEAEAVRQAQQQQQQSEEKAGKDDDVSDLRARMHAAQNIDVTAFESSEFVKNDDAAIARYEKRFAQYMKDILKHRVDILMNIGNAEQEFDPDAIIKRFMGRCNQFNARMIDLLMRYRVYFFLPPMPAMFKRLLNVKDDNEANGKMVAVYFEHLRALRKAKFIDDTGKRVKSFDNQMDEVAKWTAISGAVSKPKARLASETDFANDQPQSKWTCLQQHAQQWQASIRGRGRGRGGVRGRGAYRNVSATTAPNGQLSFNVNNFIDDTDQQEQFMNTQFDAQNAAFHQQHHSGANNYNQLQHGQPRTNSVDSAPTPIFNQRQSSIEASAEALNVSTNAAANSHFAQSVIRSTDKRNLGSLDFKTVLNGEQRGAKLFSTEYATHKSVFGFRLINKMAQKGTKSVDDLDFRAIYEEQMNDDSGKKASGKEVATAVEDKDGGKQTIFRTDDAALLKAVMAVRLWGWRIGSSSLNGCEIIYNVIKNSEQSRELVRSSKNSTIAKVFQHKRSFFMFVEALNKACVAFNADIDSMRQDIIAALKKMYAKKNLSVDAEVEFSRYSLLLTVEMCDWKRLNKMLVPVVEDVLISPYWFWRLVTRIMREGSRQQVSVSAFNVYTHLLAETKTEIQLRGNQVQQGVEWVCEFVSEFDPAQLAKDESDKIKHDRLVDGGVPSFQGGQQGSGNNGQGAAIQKPGKPTAPTKRPSIKSWMDSFAKRALPGIKFTAEYCALYHAKNMVCPNAGKDHCRIGGRNRSHECPCGNRNCRNIADDCPKCVKN